MEIIWSLPEGQHMVPEKKGDLIYLVYPGWEDQEEYVHGFSTRLGGVSQGMYSSMNLSFTRGDEETAVQENFRRISEAVGFFKEDLVCSDQTHTTNVRRVGKQDRGKGITNARIG